MYSYKSNLILGFHGCDESIRDIVVSGKDDLKISRNDYDWLGHGVYFWEQNPDRAFEYAKSLSKSLKKTNKKIETPSVIGAVID